MLSLPVYKMDGTQSGKVSVDPQLLGGEVRHALIKQAIVTFLNHQRQDSGRTKGRSDVEGSTRKLYRQKGTGNARAGTIRTPIRRGGGRTFAKRGPRSVNAFPKKMRRLARNSAILAKMQSAHVCVVEDLSLPEVKTKPMAAALGAMGAESGCVLALHERDRNVYLSSRNIPRTDVRLIEELNAYEVLRRKRLIFTRQALDQLLADPVTLRNESKDA